MSKPPRISKKLPDRPSESVRFAAFALGAVFLFAGGLKAYGPWDFIASLSGYGVPGWMRPPTAFVIPAVEILIGVFLVVGWHLRKIGAGAGLMMIAFMAAIANGWLSGTLEECGCFGPFLERSPAQALLLDVVFLSLAGWVWKGSSVTPLRLSGLQQGVGLGAVALAVATTAAAYNAPSPSLDAGNPVAGSLDDPSIVLNEGERLLYLFHPECPHCQAMTPRVVEYVDEASLPPLIGITWEESVPMIRNYLGNYDLAIPVRQIPGQSLMRITGEGSVPQLVYVRNGEVVRSWLGELPSVQELTDSMVGT